jgi:ATP-dependent Clp protease ATP-binding subunit ClpA
VQRREAVLAELRTAFRPEFLNRLDGVMVFRNLVQEQIREIVDLEMNRVRLQLAEQEIQLELTDEVRDVIAEAGFDPDYGARPLRRVIQDKIEDRLSEGLLSGEFKPGDTVRIVLGPDKRIDLETVTSEDTSDPEVAEALPG